MTSMFCQRPAGCAKGSLGVFPLAWKGLVPRRGTEFDDTGPQILARDGCTSPMTTWHVAFAGDGFDALGEVGLGGCDATDVCWREEQGLLDGRAGF